MAGTGCRHGSSQATWTSKCQNLAPTCRLTRGISAQAPEDIGPLRARLSTCCPPAVPCTGPAACMYVHVCMYCALRYLADDARPTWAFELPGTCRARTAGVLGCGRPLRDCVVALCVVRQQLCKHLFRPLAFAPGRPHNAKRGTHNVQGNSQLLPTLD